MNGYWGGWRAIALGVCLTHSMLARAQDTADEHAEHAEPAGYTDLINQALEERDVGHFEEAHALFLRAHAMFPNARTLRALGMVEFDLRDYRTSAEYLEQSLTSRARALTGAMRDSVNELLARARGFLGSVALSVEPADARVEVDGTLLSGDRAQPLSLNFGEHRLDVSAPGFVRETRKVNVRAGESQALRIVLTAQAIATAPPPNSGESTAPASAKASGPGALPFVVVGIGGALVASGAVLLVLAQGDIDDVEGAPRGTRWSAVSGAYDAAPVESGVGFALLGVGAAGALAGLIWALGDKDDDRAQAGRVRVALSPAGARLSGVF